MVSKRSAALIACDWVVVVAATAIALALSVVTPDFHQFSLSDLSISYGHRPQPKVSPALCILLAVLAPGIIIAALSVYPSGQRTWQTRLRSLNTSVLGLAVSLATATIVFTGVKNLTGRPRPDFLECCEPDFEDVRKYAVGSNYGRRRSDELWTMVTVEICQQQDKAWLRDGFRSFPSGYATIAFAGLWYLSLYLVSRFTIVPQRARIPQAHVDGSDEQSPTAVDTPFLGLQARSRRASAKIIRPVIFLVLPYVPLGLAIFIAGTRYFDFRNHGVDVLAGAAVGTVAAQFAFRLYGHQRE